MPPTPDGLIVDGRTRPLRRLLPSEDFALILAASVVAVIARWPIISSPHVYDSDDAIILAWMRQWRDPALFHDGMTRLLKSTGFPPPGVDAVYRFATYFGDPTDGAKVLGIVLAALSAWLVFRIVRMLSAWRPGAWIAAGLFLAAWDIARVGGGFSHSFAHPAVLGTVLLLLARRRAAAALVPPLAALFYPPAALVALGVLAVHALASLRPVRIDPAQAALTVAGTVTTGLVLRFVTGSGDPFTYAESRRYPEFGEHGTLHFFLPSKLEMLRQNYSGFDLRISGSIVVVAAILLLVAGRVGLPRALWGIAASSLFWFAAAYATLFRLYLPSRYVYGLLPFSAIAVGVALKPAWDRFAAPRRPSVRTAIAVAAPLLVFPLAIWVFPLGVSAGLGEGASYVPHVLPWVGAALAAVSLVALYRRSSLRRWPTSHLAAVAGVVLVAQVAWAGGIGRPVGLNCPQNPVVRYLSRMPPDTVVAGDPSQLTCIPLSARRPVVISRKQFQPLLGRSFFLDARRRLQLELEAYYGHSFAPIRALVQDYGADVMLVQPASVRNPGDWLLLEPYSDVVWRALREAGGPASLRMPQSCRLWGNGRSSLYDLHCVDAWAARRASSSS